VAGTPQLGDNPRDRGSHRASPASTFALHQLPDDLLGEKRVPGGPLGDDRRQLGHRGIRSQQLTQQRRGVRITQWGKRYRLRAALPASALPS